MLFPSGLKKWRIFFKVVHVRANYNPTNARTGVWLNCRNGSATKEMLSFWKTLTGETRGELIATTVPSLPCSFHSTHPNRMTSPPLGPCGRKDVGSAAPICLPDCPCANTAVVSWGERRLITDCSLFLPASLREPDAVNWTATPWGRVSCWWDWPLPHENCIICQKIFPTALLSMQRSFPCGTLSQGRCSPALPCNLLLSNPLKLLF